MEGRVIVYGDFRARCGGLRDLDDDSSMVVSDRKGVDLVKFTRQVAGVQSSGLCIVKAELSPCRILVCVL